MHPGKVCNCNSSKADYLKMHSLQNDRSIFIKQEGKGSRVVVWDKIDSLKESEKQLSDEKSKEIIITEKN